MKTAKQENEIVKLKNALFSQQNYLNHYSESIKSEHGMPIEFVVDVYGEAGFIFPELVIKRIEDVVKFHKGIVANRKDYLKPEMEIISKEILALTSQIAVLEGE